MASLGLAVIARINISPEASTTVLCRKAVDAYQSSSDSFVADIL